MKYVKNKIMILILGVTTASLALSVAGAAPRIQFQSIETNASTATNATGPATYNLKFTDATSSGTDLSGVLWEGGAQNQTVVLGVPSIKGDAMHAFSGDSNYPNGYITIGYTVTAGTASVTGGPYSINIHPNQDNSGSVFEDKYYPPVQSGQLVCQLHATNDTTLTPNKPEIQVQCFM